LQDVVELLTNISQTPSSTLEELELIVNPEEWPHLGDKFPVIVRLYLDDSNHWKLLHSQRQEPQDIDWSLVASAITGGIWNHILVKVHIPHLRVIPSMN
jgi:hypothetical protein